MHDRADLFLTAGYTEQGALLAFSKNVTTLLVRTGTSYISADQACSNAAAEIPEFDFASVESTARATWNELLGRIQITTDAQDADQAEKRSLLYSSVRAAGRRDCCYAELLTYKYPGSSRAALPHAHQPSRLSVLSKCVCLMLD